MTPCAVCASRPQTATQTSRTATTTTATIAATTATIDPNVCCSATSVAWVPCAPSPAETYSQLRECCERLGHASIVRSDSHRNRDSNQDTKYNNRRKAGAVATPAQSCCWREVDGVKLVGVSESAPELSASSEISSSVRLVELTTDNQQRINKYKMDTSASCCSRSSTIPTSSTSATTTIVVPRSHLTHDHHCHHCHHRENHTSTPSLSLLQSSTMSPSSSTSSLTTCTSCASSSVSYDYHLHQNHREQQQQQASSRNCSVRQQSCRSRTSRTVAQWSLIPCIVLLALATAADACSTRSTPKARSSYISQLHQQQPQQYPRPVQHYPPLLPRHPSPIQDTPTPSQTVPARAPYSQQQQSAQPQQDQQQIPQQQQPQKSQLIPSVPTVSDADLTTQRPNVTFRTYPCPEAYAKWYCLNGAHCFSVKIGESVLYNCECADGYMGQRCEFKDLDGTYIQRRGILIQTASIAFSVLVVVFLVVIIILYTVHSRQQQQLHKENGQYVYRDWSAVVTAKQVPVTVLTPDILERTV